MKLFRDVPSPSGRTINMRASRQARTSGLVWVKIVAIILLVPSFSWVALDLTPNCALDFAMHMATYGEHYEPYGYHTPPEVEKPQASRSSDAVAVDLLLTLPLFGLLPVDHLAHDRPPPLVTSPSHSLRAPPTLISA